jgi:hypothetical protein
MLFADFLTAADYRISQGGEFQWNCYPNAQFLDITDIDGVNIGSCVFSTKTHRVYEVEVYISDDSAAYRWMDPEWAKDYNEEAKNRNVDPKKAYDNVYFTPVDTEDEILHIMRSVAHKTYVHHRPEVVDDLKTDSTKSFCCCDSSGGECSSKCSKKDENAEESNATLEEFQVVIGVDHHFSVKAPTMDEAIRLAHQFTSNMKPSAPYPSGVAWMDSYASKETVTRELVTTSITDHTN